MIRRALYKLFEPLLERISRRLANKLILLFTLIIILVVSSLTYISYGMLRKESVNNSIASTSNNLLLVGRNVAAYCSAACGRCTAGVQESRCVRSGRLHGPRYTEPR